MPDIILFSFIYYPEGGGGKAYLFSSAFEGRGGCEGKWGTGRTRGVLITFHKDLNKVYNLHICHSHVS